MALPSDAFRTCTSRAPDTYAYTSYVMLTVFPEYVTLLDSVGAAYCANKFCCADAALSRPLALPNATTTILMVSVCAIEIVAV